MASPNFIMENANSFRTTNFNSNLQYDIGELNFYISAKTLSNHQVFLVMKNEKNMMEIIELQKAGTQATNVLYKVPLNQKLRINNEKVLISLMILDGETGTYQMSSRYAVNIYTDHYELARQIYIAQQVNAQTQAAYAKILAMTEENRKMYQEIKERG